LVVLKDKIVVLGLVVEDLGPDKVKCRFNTAVKIFTRDSCPCSCPWSLVGLKAKYVVLGLTLGLEVLGLEVD